MPAPTLWSPITVGAVELKHRCVMAPLTRNRASKSTKHERTWVPNDLMCEYYGQRATDGGLIISEATPVSLVASGMFGVPGLFTDEHLAGWKKVTDAVHAKGGLMFVQLWHQGRNSHSSVSGSQPVSSSAVPITDSPHAWRGLPTEPFEVPHALTVEEIQETQQDFVKAALMAREAGFDGVEIHAANGYLFDQFHHDNINKRTDAYGGSLEKRCKFTLETAEKIIAAIGADRFGVRLAPFGYFNQTRGEQRAEQWTYLCEEISKLNPAYVHLIEPRFDEVRSENEKLADLGKEKLAIEEISLKPFRKALGKTTVIAAGGYNDDNCYEGIESGEHDLVAFGRYFCSNGDLVERLKEKKPLYHYDRSRFYGPFDDNEIGYTVHPNQTFKSS
ncbi:FMN-linked oxidoreductase [Meredithblackwellia eburnea MCA 4105]